LNFFLPNGPLDLCVWNHKCKYIAMKMLPEGSVVATVDSYKKLGHNIGESFKFAQSGQRLIFKDDNFENIKYEFDRYVADI